MMAQGQRPPPLHPRNARGVVQSPQWQTPQGPTWDRDAASQGQGVVAPRATTGVSPSGPTTRRVTPHFRAMKSEGL